MTGGRAASIDKEVGGAISLFGGDIRGRNIELVRGEARRAGVAVAGLARGRLFNHPLRAVA